MKAKEARGPLPTGSYATVFHSSCDFSVIALCGKSHWSGQFGDAVSAMGHFSDGGRKRFMGKKSVFEMQ